ncbi:MAG: hypothetical protein K6G90_00100 [Clostridia bacterium]|nr:hypothetical protein [Clostridia bacterium]
MTVLFAILRKSFCWLFAALFALTGAFSSPSFVTGADLRLENEYSYLYLDGSAFCQGITTDGTYFYGTGCIKYLNYNAAAKIDAAGGDIVLCRDMCLPAEVAAKGYSHLGDCAYHDGKVYAACEAFFFRDPAVMVFDAESLDFLEYHVLPAEGQGNGHFPWLCVKDDTIYYTQARDVDEIRMLDLSDFSYKGSLKTDMMITRITGGDILGDVLYLSSNSPGREKITYSVDLRTGETKEAFVRDTGNAMTEAEGLSISQKDGAVYFHYLDVPFASQTVIRTYRYYYAA